MQRTKCKSNSNIELQLSTSQLRLQLADFGHLINYNLPVTVVYVCITASNAICRRETAEDLWQLEHSRRGLIPNVTNDRRWIITIIIITIIISSSSMSFGEALLPRWMLIKAGLSGLAVDVVRWTDRQRFGRRSDSAVWVHLAFSRTQAVSLFAASRAWWLSSSSSTLGIFGVVPRCRPLAARTRFRWYPSFDRLVFWHAY